MKIKGSSITPMKRRMKLQTTKIYIPTLKMLRMIYAITGERMASIVHRLVEQELKKINKQ